MVEGQEGQNGLLLCHYTMVGLAFVPNPLRTGRDPGPSSYLGIVGLTWEPFFLASQSPSGLLSKTHVC